MRIRSIVSLHPWSFRSPLGGSLTDPIGVWESFQVKAAKFELPDGQVKSGRQDRN